MLLWIVGSGYGKEWELQGIFTTKEKAFDNCVGNDWFVGGPVEVDTILPTETLEFPNITYC